MCCVLCAVCCVLCAVCCVLCAVCCVLCRDFTPSDGHPVLALSWSPTGDAFLVVLSSAQPRIYDR
jgi:hypothetical protein